MLSFFRRKSESETSPKPEEIQIPSVSPAKDALLEELGYSDSNELKETIYGKFMIKNSFRS